MLLEYKVNELQATEKSLQNALEAYEAGVYSLHEFAERKRGNEEKITQLKKEIVEIEKQLEGIMRYSQEELEELIKEFKENWHKVTTVKKQNQLLKSIVSRIWYDKEGDTVTFEIEYR